MPAVAGRLPHQGTEIRRVLERLAVRPMTAAEVGDMLGIEPAEASARLFKQRRRKRVVRIDNGPRRGRLAKAVYTLTERARTALRIEREEGRRVALFAA